jgi:hypothetical protein
MRIIQLISACAFVASTAASADAQGIDWAKIDSTFGRTAAVAGEVHRYGFPRTDLQVTLDGVTIRPAFALGGWIEALFRLGVYPSCLTCRRWHRLPIFRSRTVKCQERAPRDRGVARYVVVAPQRSRRRSGTHQPAWLRSGRCRSWLGLVQEEV